MFIPYRKRVNRIAELTIFENYEEETFYVTEDGIPVTTNNSLGVKDIEIATIREESKVEDLVEMLIAQEERKYFSYLKTFLKEEFPEVAEDVLKEYEKIQNTS